MTTEEMLQLLSAEHKEETVAVTYEPWIVSIIIGDREYPFRRPYSLDNALRLVITREVKP